MDMGSSNRGSVISDPSIMIEAQMKKMEERNKISNGVLAVITLIYTISFLFVTGEACARDDLSRLS
jgi:uncharacterized membrane protein YkgB